MMSSSDGPDPLGKDEEDLDLPEDAEEILDDAGEVVEEAADAVDVLAEDAGGGDGDEDELDEEVEKLDFGDDPFAPPAAPQTKHCAFCTSEISIAAARCPHCAGFLPIAEGAIFKQYFFFLFASLALVIGCLLPWERTYFTGNLTGADSIGGAFLLLFAGYGIVVSVWNIYHRKMIVWPVMLAALDGAVLGWQRVIQLLPRASDAYDLINATKYNGKLEGFAAIQTKLKVYLGTFGPGLYLVVIFSTLVLLSVVVSIFKGAKQDAKRKQEEREARAAARTSRKGSRR